ncbi:3-dehydroquinate dehydratase [Thermoplasma sp. Kam2015]|uniref:type I 3-dehydroquinate dehydratase n=1 Tax=Thermoplasma sp. Kam2015 TaxID=2094122 RepID=UPI000D9F7AA6|nr:type I 3-dehydroquinate dehydratase [Thermoplasma sp. Kam2015]PYB69095.1 3-dehydroquinate dehydratase [Thermoplasma sp. Kam2015]
MPLYSGDKLNIGKFVIGNAMPIVVTSVFYEDVDTFVDKLQTKILSDKNLYEIRFDMFTEREISDEEELISAMREMDIDYIFTYRGKDALKYYETAIKKMAPAVDLDMSLIDKLEQRSRVTKIIGSYHTSDAAAMMSALDRMMNSDVDMVKVACSYSDDQEFLTDLNRIIDVRKDKKKPMAFIPMGRTFWRAIAGYYVSDIVYAMGDRPTAYGQPKADYYYDAFKMLFQ